MNLKGDYWKYYTQVEYNSPVYYMEVDENGKTKRLNKCCFPVRLVYWEEYNVVAYPILSISPTLLTRRLKIEEGKYERNNKSCISRKYTSRSKNN